jgi:DnaJ-class molecular chaperone
VFQFVGALAITVSGLGHPYISIFLRQKIRFRSAKTLPQMDKRLKSLKILKLPSNANHSEIKSKYLQQVMLNHPDKGGSKEKFMEIKKAYETLNTVTHLTTEYPGQSGYDETRKDTKESYKFKSKIIGFSLTVTVLFIINFQFQSQSKRHTRIQQQIGSKIASKRIS